MCGGVNRKGACIYRQDEDSSGLELGTGAQRPGRDTRVST